ncbi:MAG: sugar O-acetyltransferase, partial [Clostridia bacterium]|nr:sugar O-acetyltransferase [Clostridia bacterium]
MTEKEKSKLGFLYNPYTKDLIEDRSKCKDLCFKFNSILPSDIDNQRIIINKLIDDPSNTAIITAPFWCDYGYNITVGKNFYCNHNLIILDEANVNIGDNVFIAPHCCITTAGHPIDAQQRSTGIEIALPVTIGNDVWIGA